MATCSARLFPPFGPASWPAPCWPGHALGEFGATITFAGNFPGRTQTMPLAIYLANEIDPDEAIVLSLVLIAVSFAVLVMLRDDTSRAATRRDREPRRQGHCTLGTSRSTRT